MHGGEGTNDEVQPLEGSAETAPHTDQHSPGSRKTDMGFRNKTDDNVQRMMTDDEYVFTYVAMANTHKWLGGQGTVRFYHLAGALGVVRRLRERVQAQE
jgi:hypothetical protein